MIHVLRISSRHNFIMGKAAEQRRLKQQLKELQAKTAVMRAAAREMKSARMASEINLLISAADEAYTVQELQAALAKFNGLEGGWCNLVQYLS